MRIIDDDLLTKALDDVGSEARANVAESVYVALFNTSNEVLGNTEASDVMWFAAEIWSTVALGGRSQFDSLPDAEREHWRNIALACLRRLPLLMSRIAHRCEAHAKLINSLLTAERAARRNGK